MSTRSTIMVKVKASDKCKELTHKSGKKLYTTKIVKDYLVKYNHWDGYPEGVGKILLDKFNSYDKVLELMSGGDSSAIYDNGSVSYYIDMEDRDEKWENVCPHQNDEPFLPIGWTEWCYKFDRGQWYVAPVNWSGNGGEKIGKFHKLTPEYIEKHPY